MLEIRSGADCRRAVQQPLSSAAQQCSGKPALLRRAHDQHDRLDVLGKIGQAVRG